MEGSSLFNPGFLGGNFSWWIGQIPDNATWRENIIPYVHPDVTENKGWGYRYKVRILGLHEWGEDSSIKSEQLPWAQVMYPVTSGGYLGNSASTPGIKQGNIVFGFFMDQQEQQIPVIMGVLGNNAQTVKNYKINNGVSDNSSGSIINSAYQTSKDGNFQQKVADSDTAISKNGDNTTLEGSDLQVITNSDQKRQKDREIPHVLLSPCNINESAMTGVQTALENLVNHIDGWLSTFSSYADAISSAINSTKDMKKMIRNISCEIAKYIKIIMDNVMQYVLKLLNKSLTPMVAGLPSTMRSMFGDIKEIITQLILCLYNKMTEGLCDMIDDMLSGTFNIEELEKEAREASDEGRTHPEVPICYAEDLVSKVMAANKQEIDDANQSIVDKLDVFISDIQEEMAGLTDSFADIQTAMGDITGGISGALSFSNVSLNIFGCELSPSCSTTDYFTLNDGASSHTDAQAVSNSAVSATIPNTKSGDGSGSNPKPFLGPHRGTEPVYITGEFPSGFA